MIRAILLLLLSTLFSCSNDDQSIGLPGDPANLSIDITPSEENDGEIMITATAEKVEHYQFNLGDGSTVITNTTGVVNHTYSKSNFYNIEVRAYGSSGRYIKQSRQIAVELADVNSDDGFSSPLSYSGYSLLWQDEFNGTGIDQTKWTFEIGDGCDRGLCGWGNNELQYYRSENTSVADGYLTITAKNEAFGGRSYTSSRLKTQDKFEFKFGRVDIRAKLPEGQGIWPALWMLGANINTTPWPACGEVDIMEMIGGGAGRDNTVHGTVHWSNAGSHAEHSGSRTLLTGNLGDLFHVYSIVWNQTSITWYIDDKQFHTTLLSDPEKSEFLEDFFLLMNIAVGGNWPGSPDGTTIFPQQMKVDYIRVFQPN